MTRGRRRTRRRRRRKGGGGGGREGGGGGGREGGRRKGGRRYSRDLGDAGGYLMPWNLLDEGGVEVIDGRA
jgi:hypothetical protein